jgi:hypothetical protein
MTFIESSLQATGALEFPKKDTFKIPNHFTLANLQLNEEYGLIALYES